METSIGFAGLSCRMDRRASIPRKLSDCFSIEDIRLLASRKLPQAVFDLYDGGAEDESTLKANRKAFSAYRFAPRVLVDVSNASTSCEFLAAPAPFPVGIGPTGGAGFGYRHADLALAKAAAKLGIPYTLSSSATTSIETIARHAPGRLWFQAYVLKNQPFFWKMVERARQAEYEGLVITVDLPVGGKRERDMRNHFSVPFKFTTRNVVDFASRPRWALDMLIKGMPVIENLRGLELAATDARSIASTVGKGYDASFDWDRLAEVRDRWPRKLIVKGIASREDAARLARMGVDAIVVSNHGGRQLDGALASLEALPEVLLGAGAALPVLLDGGIRRGSDIAKALALGAHGVLLGRATLFGAVSAGDAGAMRALEILQSELLRTMQLCGITNHREWSRDFLRSAEHWFESPARA